MLRRLLTLPLILCLLVIIIGSDPSSAAAEPSALTGDELVLFTDSLRRAALNAGYYEVLEAETGYALRYRDYVLYTDTPELTEESEIFSVIFDTMPEEGDVVQPDLRGVCPGDTLAFVLSLYPNRNEALRGTREEAALYVSGDVASAAASGVLKRDGQSAEAVVHRLYQPADGGVNVRQVEYVISWNAVSMIRMQLKPVFLTVREARAELEAAEALLRTNEYTAYLPAAMGGQAETFNRDDLIFSGLDFLWLTPEDAEAVLGYQYEETWIRDGVNWLHTMTWPGLSITFVHGEDRLALYADSLYLSDSLLEGPRGLMPGIPLDEALSRFCYAATELTAPSYDLYRVSPDEYAALEAPTEGLAVARYYCRAENRKVMLRLAAEGGIVKDLTLQLVRE